MHVRVYRRRQAQRDRPVRRPRPQLALQRTRHGQVNRSVGGREMHWSRRTVRPQLQMDTAVRGGRFHRAAHRIALDASVRSAHHRSAAHMVDVDGAVRCLRVQIAAQAIDVDRSVRSLDVRPALHAIDVNRAVRRHNALQFHLPRHVQQHAHAHGAVRHRGPYGAHRQRAAGALYVELDILQHLLC